MCKLPSTLTPSPTPGTSVNGVVKQRGMWACSWGEAKVTQVRTLLGWRAKAAVDRQRLKIRVPGEGGGGRVTMEERSREHPAVRWLPGELGAEASEMA